MKNHRMSVKLRRDAGFEMAYQAKSRQDVRKHLTMYTSPDIAVYTSLECAELPVAQLVLTKRERGLWK